MKDKNKKWLGFFFLFLLILGGGLVGAALFLRVMTESRMKTSEKKQGDASPTPTLKISAATSSGALIPYSQRLLFFSDDQLQITASASYNEKNEQVIDREFIQRLIHGPAASVEIYSDIISKLISKNDYTAKYIRLVLTQLPEFQIAVVPLPSIEILLGHAFAGYAPPFKTIIVPEITAQKVDITQATEIEGNLKHEFKHAFWNAFSRRINDPDSLSMHLSLPGDITSFTLIKQMTEQGNQRVKETIDLLRKEKCGLPLTMEEKSRLQELRKEIVTYGCNQFIFINKNRSYRSGSIIMLGKSFDRKFPFDMKFHIDSTRQALTFERGYSFSILRPTTDTDPLIALTYFIDLVAEETKQDYPYNKYFSELDAELTARFPAELIKPFYRELIDYTNAHTGKLQEMSMCWSQRQSDLVGIAKIISATANDVDDYLLGLQYYKGTNGKQPNFAKAAEYFKLSADQKNPYAQYALGQMYFEGKGVTKNIGKAMRLLRLAAEQGHRKAQYLIGGIYFNGKDVTKNIPEAMKWLQLAANAGENRAEYAVGVGYYNGENGMPQDIRKAMALLWDSADQGNTEAIEKLREIENSQPSTSMIP
jgi:TPR repeat protein